jgi:hypothetical protein
MSTESRSLKLGPHGEWGRKARKYEGWRTRGALKASVDEALTEPKEFVDLEQNPTPLTRMKNELKAAKREVKRWMAVVRAREDRNERMREWYRNSKFKYLYRSYWCEEKEKLAAAIQKLEKLEADDLKGI